MSTESSFEMYEVLLERQNITRAERLTLKALVDASDAKIKNLIAHVKNRPRESDEELVKRIEEVERYHSTHPQTNKDEREFMRELKALKAKRKELVEYNIKQGEIDMLKSQRSAYQRELKEKEICLDELYAGARKMRAAHKLKCDPNDLQEETMSIPKDKFRLVIGAAGSNVKKMEDECFVCIDMDRGKADAIAGKLKLFYDPAHNNVEEAKRLIQVILDTRIEEWSLSDEKITCLLNKRAAIVMKLQEMYNVRIDVSKAKLLCKVSGLSDNVGIVMTAINSLEVATSKVDLVEKVVLSYLLGKGRPDFQSMLEEHSVDVHLDKEASPPTATVVGAKASVIAVTAILKEIVEANKEIEEELTFDKHVVVDAIIGAKGVIISQLQRDFNVRLTVDKEKSTSTTATVEIKGTAIHVQAAKEHIAERIQSFQSDTVVIAIPEGLLAGILGKKGARITALRQKHPEVTIDVDADNSLIRLHSTKRVQRLSAADAVEAYIAANMQKDFFMNRSTTISLKGARGAEARKHLSDTLQLKFDIDTENEVIHIRGRNPDIEQALQYLTTFCEDNFEIEVSCNHEDAASLLNGKDDSTLRHIENKFEVKMFYSRKNDTFRIIGQRDAVNDAKQYIVDFLEGTVENSALVSITAGGIGALVGRGGNHIKSFEKKHGVYVDILKPREQVRLHGRNAEAVEVARLDLLGFLDNLSVNMTLENVHEAWAGRCDSITGTLDDLLNRSKSMFGVGINKIEKVLSEVGDSDEVQGGENAHCTKKALSVTFFGTPRRATAAKEFVLDEISGVTTAHLTVLPHHIEQLSSPANLAKLKQNASSAHVTASLSDTAIVLKGPVAFMSKAKIQINRLLDFLFTGEFSSVVADSRTLLALWNFATEMDFKTQVVGGQISFDMRMSCVRVYASTSISHTLGVEYIRNAIAECKKRVAMIEVNAEVYNIIMAKKSIYFGPIETKHKCKLTVQMNRPQIDDDDATAQVQYMVVIEGTTENKTNDGVAAMKATIARLEKEHWKISLRGDVVGALIGKGGQNVKALREETKANIIIDMRSGSVEVNGKEAHVSDAKARILQFVAEKEHDSHVTFVPITPDCIPRIIGTKGATIRELRLACKAVSIDIHREDHVVVVKGSVEAGQKAKEDITALLMKDNIDISKLQYITPEERRAAAKKKADADKADERKKQSVSISQATGGKASSNAGTREGYLALLNAPGISKSTVRRFKRKMRDEEQKGEDKQQQGSTSNTQSASQQASEEVDESNDNSVDSSSEKNSMNKSKSRSPSSVVDRDSMSSASTQPFAGTTTTPAAPPARLDLDLEPSDSLVSSHVHVNPPPSLPSGVAGNLLSMILGTTPVPAVSTTKGGGTGSVATRQQQHLDSAHSLAGEESVGRTSSSNSNSYFKSRTGGRAIRLD